MPTQPSSAAERNEPEPNKFVSAVCWMKGSSVLLAANSQGQIKVSVLLGAYLVTLTFTSTGPRDVLELNCCFN